MPAPPSPPSRHHAPALPWQVALPLPIPAYDFLPPHGWPAAPVPLGHRVLVPWRGELTVGVVVGISEQTGSHRLREAVHVLDGHPWVHPAFVEAAWGLSRLARTPLGLLLSDLLGVGWDAKYSHQVRAVAESDLSLFGKMVPGADWKVPGAAWTDAGQYPGGVLDAIREQGLLDERFAPVPRTVTGYRALEAGITALTKRQQDAWTTLQAAGPLGSQSDWAAQAGVSPSVVAQVLARGA